MRENASVGALHGSVLSAWSTGNDKMKSDAVCGNRSSGRENLAGSLRGWSLRTAE